jgi:hypothetical protein
MKNNSSPKSLRQWRSQKREVLATSASMADATLMHAFLNKQTDHNGKRPKMGTKTLQNLLTMYRELRDNDHIVTLNMLAAKVWRMDSGSKDLSLSALRRRIYWHLHKCGVVRRCVARVTQKTRYDEGFKAGYVAFVNTGLKAGKYKASDIVNIDETNVDFDLVSGSILAVRGEKSIGCATTGSSSRYTILLGITMDGEKLPSYIIFKGANADVSYQEGVQGRGGLYQVWLS